MLFGSSDQIQAFSAACLAPSEFLLVEPNTEDHRAARSIHFIHVQRSAALFLPEKRIDDALDDHPAGPARILPLLLIEIL
jgi:hypothetical protein